MSYVVIDVIISVLVFVALFYGFKRLQDRKKARQDASARHEAPGQKDRSGGDQ